MRITTVVEILERLALNLKGFRDRYPSIKFEMNTEQRLLSLSHRSLLVSFSIYSLALTSPKLHKWQPVFTIQVRVNDP